jgi:hypothetical protein
MSRGKNRCYTSNVVFDQRVNNDHNLADLGMQSPAKVGKIVPETHPNRQSQVLRGSTLGMD